jgi:NAD(P)-dependent dehydrogenase (short-subunit alcohol dehydrogenase family)
MNAKPLAGSIVLVTGSTDGIGKETAFELARRGATVILHGRNRLRCQQTLDEAVRKTGNSTLGCYAADLSTMEGIRHLAGDLCAKYERLDVLINNAGVFMNDRVLTADGYEMTFAVNHLAPFLLTNLLWKPLAASGHARIITVSSMAHQRGRIDFDNLQGEKRFTGYDAYARSKLANILFANELAERAREIGATSNALHPGIVATKLLRVGFGNMAGTSVREGAATPVYLATSPDLADVTGRYFVKCAEGPVAPLASDPVLRKQLWDVSEELSR